MATRRCAMRSHNTRFRLQTVDAGYWRQFALPSLDFLFVCLSSIVSTVKRLQVQGFFSLFCCFFPTLILFHSLTHITHVPQSNFKQHDALLRILYMYSVQCTATAVAPATTATHKICVVCVWIWKYVNIYTHKQNIKMWNIHFFFIYMLIDSLDGTKSFALHSWMARRRFVWSYGWHNSGMTSMTYIRSLFHAIYRSLSIIMWFARKKTAKIFESIFEANKSERKYGSPYCSILDTIWSIHK